MKLRRWRRCLMTVVAEEGEDMDRVDMEGLLVELAAGGLALRRWQEVLALRWWVGCWSRRHHCASVSLCAGLYLELAVSVEVWGRGCMSNRFPS